MENGEINESRLDDKIRKTMKLTLIYIDFIMFEVLK